MGRSVAELTTVPSRSTSAAVIVGEVRALGPLETPAVALRWRITGPFGFACRHSGWVGNDLVLAIGGEHVTVPLAGLTLRADANYWLRTYDMPRVLPDWVARYFRRGVGMWWELSFRPGTRVWLEEDAPRRPGGYRSAEGPRIAQHPVLYFGSTGSKGSTGRDGA